MLAASWKRYLAGALIGAIIALSIAWAYMGGKLNDGQGNFELKISPLSVIKVIEAE